MNEELDLDHIERIARQRQEAGGRVTARPSVILALIARLRAAELDAARYRYAVAHSIIEPKEEAEIDATMSASKEGT